MKTALLNLVILCAVQFCLPAPLAFGLAPQSQLRSIQQTPLENSLAEIRKLQNELKVVKLKVQELQAQHEVQTPKYKHSLSGLGNFLKDSTLSAIDYLRNTEKVLVLFAFSLLVVEVLGHTLAATAFIVHPMSLALGGIGVLLYALPMIAEGFKSGFEFFKRALRGQSPWEALDEEFTKGLALFLLLLLPFALTSIPLDLAAIALIAVVIQLAEVLEEHMVAIQERAMQDLKHELPDTATISRIGDQRYAPGTYPELSIQDIQEALDKGQEVVVLVKQEETVPKVDGTILSFEPQARTDRSVIFGESKPVRPSLGDEIVGGSLVTGGSIEVLVQKTGEQTSLGQMEKSMSEFDPQGFSEVKSLTDKVIKYFGLSLVIVAIAGFLITGSINVGIAALASICACAFLVGVPLSFVAARQNLASHHITATRAEAFSPINVLVLDKTKTITKETMVLEERIPLWNMSTRSNKELLEIAALAERPFQSSNPYAKALFDEAVKQGTNEHWLLNHPSQSESLGSGVIADIQGQGKVFLGNMRALDKAVSGPIDQKAALEDKVSEFTKEGITPIIMYDLRRNQALGIWRIQYELRDGVDQLIHNFLNMGDLKWYHKLLNTLSGKAFRFEPFPEDILPVVASGDHRNVVQHVLRQTPIKLGLAEVTPKQKALLVQWLQTNGNLRMIRQELAARTEPLVLTWPEFAKQFAHHGMPELLTNSSKDYEQLHKEAMERSKYNKNRVGMIGDGTNDAYALKTANVGFSFESATRYSQTASDVMLGEGDNVFHNLNRFLKMQRKVYFVIFINIFVIAILWNALIISLIFSGIVGPALAAVLHAVNTVVVILVSLSLMSKPGKYLKEMFLGESSEAPSKNKAEHCEHQSLGNSGSPCKICRKQQLKQDNKAHLEQARSTTSFQSSATGAQQLHGHKEQLLQSA